MPIRDRDGVLVNVRRYKPGHESKMLNLTGWGSPTRLAFADRVPKKPRRKGQRAKSFVVVAGGEWDALAAAQEGFIAVCSSNGEGSVPIADDLEPLRGFDVVLILDADSAGVAAAQKWAHALVGIARVVKVVTLPLPKDLNDWFAEHGKTSKDLLHEISQTPAFGARRETSELLASALEQIKVGTSRNEAGFWLACQLRDERYSPEEAREVFLSEFLPVVEHLKSPPYSKAEAEGTLHSAFSRPPRAATGQSATGFLLTDIGNGERLVESHGDDMRWIPAFKNWAVWDGRRWNTKNGDTRAESWAKDTARAIWREVQTETDEQQKKALAAHAARSESANKVDAMLRMARSEKGMTLSPSAFDSDPMLFNCANGTLDFRTGQLREHNRADMCARMSPVVFDPAAQAPRWERFLERVVPDAETRAFLQRAIGYSLTGCTTEQKLMLMYGFGANGKTTFCELVKDITGDYGQQMPFETLLDRKRSPGGANSDIARLDGARFVLASESREGDRFDEQLVKQLTGDDTLTARFLHQEFFDFRPQCTVWLRTNHRPVVRGTDDAIWRRFLMVPFEVQIPEAERDSNLLVALREELPGILRWAVEGALAWQEEGLNPPAAVLDATKHYRTESDLLGMFLEDCCDVGAEHGPATKADTFAQWKVWCRGNEYVPGSANSFSRQMKQRGFEDVRVGANSTRAWAGLAVRDDESPHVFRLRQVPNEAD